MSTWHFVGYDNKRKAQIRAKTRRAALYNRLMKYIGNASLKELRYCANVIRYNKKVAKHKKSR